MRAHEDFFKCFQVDGVVTVTNFRYKIDSFFVGSSNILMGVCKHGNTKIIAFLNLLIVS